ncbi:MAG: inorganic phosphate transporter PiT family [Chloroflexi bacterium]|nr:MAG: inorganic phosphate transporter PiT family [Chloroflexota bacterium]
MEAHSNIGIQVLQNTPNSRICRTIIGCNRYPTAIMGVGAADRPSKVRWGVAGEIASAWLFTIPSTALLAAGIYWLITVGAPAMIKLF